MPFQVSTFVLSDFSSYTIEYLWLYVTFVLTSGHAYAWFHKFLFTFAEIHCSCN